jgi:hypothetical protein
MENFEVSTVLWFDSMYQPTKCQILMMHRPSKTSFIRF